MSDESHQEIIINAPLERVFQVITDYERYPEFLPENQAVQVLSRDGDRVEVRFEVEMLMRVDYVLAIEEEAPSRVAWTLQEARMLSQNRGEWRLDALASDKTRATYTLELSLARAIPSAVSDRLAGTALPKTLQRFKERAESLED